MRHYLSKSAMSDTPANTAAPVTPLASLKLGEKSCEVLSSELLFQGQREVWIEHEGERYRLRITRRGKLILQK
jgi:hemin uptake protein HemP